MLLRFRVANHASIREEVELSMVAVGDHPELAVQYAPGAGISVLPVAAIYGANATGKSNLIEAFVFMRAVVRNSHQNWRPGAPIFRRPFKLDKESKHRPSVFIAEFILDKTRYEYGFALNDVRIVSEWLYSFPKKRPRLLFERAEDMTMSFGPSLKGLRQNIAKLMRPNSLYLSAAAANNHAQLTQIYNWFDYGIMPVRASTDLQGSFTLHEWQHHDRDRIRNLLIYADTGVVGLEIDEQEVSAAVVEKFQEFMQAYDPEHADGPPFTMPQKVDFVHQGVDHVAEFPIDEESSGTLAWVLLIGPAVSAIRSGGLMVVDELDAYLHSLLAAHLVSIFQDPSTNPHGAQLLFNTHDATLLAPSTRGRLRRDQVWLTEKNKAGATKLTPLSAYRVRDQLENVEKRYLSGRYGGIPFFDDTMLESLSGE